jgi:hypothetical protein
MTFELRTYRSTPGRMGSLLARFRDHTDAIFAEHGMHSVGYWLDDADPDVLIYVLRHTGDPGANWSAFQADERWQSAKSASIEDGEIVASIRSVLMSPTDFSAATDSGPRRP